MDSKLSSGGSSEDLKRLIRRKGGGGRGGGSRGSSSGSKGGSKGGSAAAKNHGASDNFVKSRGGGKAISMPATSSSAYGYSDGGGKRLVLSKNSPFSGREAGGGTRNTIYGTSHFGSGYPYGGYGSFVSSRPLPYQFYPVPVSHNYYGGDEYLNVYDSQRPGGNLVTAIVQPSYNASSVTYRIVGDNSSVITVFDALVANCSVVNSTSAITSFTPSNTSWPLPVQVIQYYRASSFALSLDGYNNTASLPANAPVSNSSSLVQMTDTSLPLGLNMTFLGCVNTTVGASVPLVDAGGKKGLSNAEIGAIVGGSIVGFVLFSCFFCWCVRRRRESRERKWMKREQKAKEKSEVLDAPTIRVESGDDLLSSRPIVEGHDEMRDVEQPSHARQPDTSDSSSSWLSKIPFVGHRAGYRSVQHQSTSSIQLPLTDPHGWHDLETGSEHADTPSPSPSRSPSPSPYNRSPVMHAEDKLRPV